MSYKLGILGLVIFLGSVVTLPMARADEFNQQTNVTVNAPVEVPGRVLPAGQYVFKLADSAVDRNIVEISNADQSHLMATLLTVPAYRGQATSQPVITLEERPNGNPDVIGTWFFAGESEGVHFLYQ